MPTYAGFTTDELNRLNISVMEPTFQVTSLKVDNDTAGQAAIFVSVTSYPAVVPAHQGGKSSHEWRLLLAPPAAAQLSGLLKQAVKQYLRHSADSDKFEVD